MGNIRRFTILLGAGVSIPAGLPSTGEITDEILKNYDSWYKDSSTYHLKATSGQNEFYYNEHPYAEYLPKISKFLKIIATEIEQYYRTISKIDYSVNYEEIYDVINQLNLALGKEVDNPLTNRLIHSMVHAINPINPNNPNKYQEVKLLCEESEKFIRSVIKYKLEKHSCISYLYVLCELAKMEQCQNVATLNHDLLLEKAFRKHQIVYNDGFKEADNGVRFYDYSTLSENNKLNLLKLHGSIDWYNFFIEKDRTLHLKELGQYNKWQSNEESSIIVSTQKYEVDKLPSFLTGFNNKYLEYNYGVYLDLFFEFEKMLQRTEVLVIAGYGFGDNAVNLRIINWFTKQENRKIVIITPNIESTKKNARGGIYARLKDWPQDRVHWIEKGIQEVEKTEILDYINDSKDE